VSEGRTPDFDELVGDVDPAERARLERVHELLVTAGPPPELPPELADAPPEPRATVVAFPRRYRAAALGLAAAVAVIVFGVGYAIGRSTTPTEAFTVAMTGADGASAQLVVFDKDEAGNWPMKLTVHGLPALRGHRRYELWLTRRGKPVESCGTFAVVAAGETKVPLNAPYVLKDYDGWVVTADGSTTPVLRTDTV
jgi:anti-sigma-K factor RskA